MIINSKDYFNDKIKWNKSYEIIVIKTSKDVEKMIVYFSTHFQSNYIFMRGILKTMIVLLILLVKNLVLQMIF